MSCYIIRLDDACPTMNHDNWYQMEKILTRYNISPIVGVIPDNKDPEFSWQEDPSFWKRVADWQAKGWCIACHGLHHLARPYQEIENYFQRAHTFRSEWAGIPLQEQIQMLNSGIKILNEHGIYPKAFFAPAHTFDQNTVAAVKSINPLLFISDGYELCAYQKHGVTFLPSICNSPLKMPFGTFTFVFHPSNMQKKDFAHLNQFLSHAHDSVITAEEALKKIKSSQGIMGKLLEESVFILRRVRAHGGKFNATKK